MLLALVLSHVDERKRVKIILIILILKIFFNVQVTARLHRMLLDQLCYLSL